jgi:hypothetical protein
LPDHFHRLNSGTELVALNDFSHQTKAQELSYSYAVTHYHHYRQSLWQLEFFNTMDLKNPVVFLHGRPSMDGQAKQPVIVPISCFTSLTAK